MAMKLQIFMMKKSLKQSLIILAQQLLACSLDSALKKDNNYYPQAFLKDCKYTEKKVIRHIHDNLSDFSSSDESDEEQIFFDKYLNWVLFRVLLTRKYAYKV